MRRPCVASEITGIYTIMIQHMNEIAKLSFYAVVFVLSFLFIFFPQTIQPHYNKKIEPLFLHRCQALIGCFREDPQAKIDHMVHSWS